jgi:predicted ATPase
MAPSPPGVGRSTNYCLGCEPETTSGILPWGEKAPISLPFPDISYPNIPVPNIEVSGEAVLDHLFRDRRATPPMNKPVFLSSFIGREVELSEIGARLRENGARLLTLTGPGGSGKTRLAHQATEDLSEAYEDGVAWVGLVGVGGPSSLPQTLLAAMGISSGPDQSMLETLGTTLAAREMLIVLDNCEHIADACAELVTALLGACPAISFLATSRTALNVQGEHIWPVPPMSHPTGRADEETLTEYDAVNLFVARARQIRPDFGLNESNQEGVIQILDLLDGQPLAIELAAARLSVLEIAQIVERLSDQLHFLSDRAEMMGQRHRSIGAAIRWSYELLSDEECMLFRR